jgi:hypothetical protein
MIQFSLFKHLRRKNAKNLFVQRVFPAQHAETVCVTRPSCVFKKSAGLFFPLTSHVSRRRRVSLVCDVYLFGLFFCKGRVSFGAGDPLLGGFSYCICLLRLGFSYILPARTLCSHIKYHTKTPSQCLV